MAKLRVQQIRDFALHLVAKNPGGIRYGELVAAVLAAHPQTPRNTVIGSLFSFEKRFPDKVAKPARGLYMPAGAFETPPTTTTTTGGRESDFYAPLATWLQNEDEVTVARGLGGAWVRNKWATPDVVGVYKPLTRDLVKFPIEIVSAEVKTDPQQPVVAFGQAIAYRLFSMKTYIAMPEAMAEDDKGRLESLCALYGVGLVLFKTDPHDPQFRLVARAQRFAPDMFYVNEFADRLRQYDHGAFDALFG
jgi:hypothetical protein